ncbi:class I SAM-dependent methyltransferase [Chlorogloeopsis sp. ULAP01]|uniref:class I SAM-dependent methyltransferase n=1 Tax=Chlorogloeopsis sp. ULAP01 TaxID=3056483 RepID=UPI0025AB02DB|nr:class I SAM-dependent methyltransferase [Chlorogloeopsis sp. ULAP01]MDM9382686.1 class I SAM-dependent methyltransferase [Chlorogloeopsis sp. ULAP01]
MAQANLFDFDKNKSLPVSDYDVKARQLVPGYEAIFNIMFAWLQQRLPDRANLLIVGVGGGMELSVFGCETQWKMTGVDPSTEMLSAAASKVEALGLSERVELIQGTVDDVPKTALFNAATSILVMHFLPDDGSKLSFLKLINQRLESGSPLFLVDFCGERNSEQFNQIFSAWKCHAIHAGVPAEFIEEQSEKILPNLPFVPERRVTELLSEAGFTKIVQFYKALTYNGWMAIKS